MKKEQSPEHLVKKLISESSTKKKKSLKKREYSHDKELFIPEAYQKRVSSDKKVTGKKWGKTRVILQKGDRSTLEQFYCSANQNSPLYFIEKAEELQHRSVQTLKTKERWIAARSIRKLSFEMQRWISTQIDRQVQCPSNDALTFYQMLQKREERHFQIDRIIRYLSEP